MRDRLIAGNNDVKRRGQLLGNTRTVHPADGEDEGLVTELDLAGREVAEGDRRGRDTGQRRRLRRQLRHDCGQVHRSGILDEDSKRHRLARVGERIVVPVVLELDADDLDVTGCDEAAATQHRGAEQDDATGVSRQQ